MDPTLLLILAILGFWVCAGVGAALLLGWLIRRARRRHEAEVFAALCEAVERHPAGYRRPVRAGETPFSARTICGHKIFGDSLGDLVANEIHHYRSCPHVDRRKAA